MQESLSSAPWWGGRPAPRRPRSRTRSSLALQHKGGGKRERCARPSGARRDGRRCDPSIHLPVPPVKQRDLRPASLSPRSSPPSAFSSFISTSPTSSSPSSFLPQASQRGSERGVGYEARKPRPGCARVSSSSSWLAGAFAVSSHGAREASRRARSATLSLSSDSATHSQLGVSLMITCSPPLFLLALSQMPALPVFVCRFSAFWCKTQRLPSPTFKSNTCHWCEERAGKVRGRERGPREAREVCCGVLVDASPKVFIRRKEERESRRAGASDSAWFPGCSRTDIH